MKTRNFTSSFLIALLLMAMVISCSKKDEPNITPPSNQPPTCEITSPINDQKIIKGETVNISVDAVDSDGNIKEVQFFIDDVEIGRLDSPPYNYNWETINENIGPHFIKAKSLDNNNKSNSDEITIEIIEIGDPPEAAFTADQTNGIVPLVVNFNDQSINIPTSWQWDFGDGSISTSQNPEHTYNTPGIYTVTLTVENAFGSDTESISNYITVLDENAFTDPRDDQIYNTVEIGNQTWFAENLNYENSFSWWYDNDSNYGEEYGRLYNWLSARSACPTGWHLPSDDEWKELEMSLGMSQSEVNMAGWRGTDEGEKMKSTYGWISNGNGTNSSGFNALPAGNREYNSEFKYMGLWCLFWTDTPWSSNAIYRLLSYNEDRIRRYNFDISEGYSVRCIKD
jgi:uncharacterized protein (TIGR02145 family)